MNLRNKYKYMIIFSKFFYCYKVLNLKHNTINMIKMSILVFDTETTGLSNNDHIVSICWIIYSNGNEIDRKYYIIKPVGFTIPQIASDIHGITNDIAHCYGVNILPVLNEFNDCINRVNLLVAHNISFDHRMIKQEMKRNNLKIAECKTYCTMKTGKYITNIKKTNRFGEYIKYPKLIELYQHLFNESFTGQHNAIEDTIACAKCYFKMNNIPMNQNKNKIENSLNNDSD